MTCMPLATASVAVTVPGSEPDAGFQYSATDGLLMSVPGPAMSAQPITVLPSAWMMPASSLMNSAYCDLLSSVDGTSSPPRSWYGPGVMASIWWMTALMMVQVFWLAGHSAL